MNQKAQFRVKPFSILLILLALSLLAGCGSRSATGGPASPTASQGKPEATTLGAQFLTTHSRSLVKWQNGGLRPHGVFNPSNGAGCPAAGKRVSPPPQVEPGIQATQTVVFVAPAEVCGRMNVLWHDCDRATYGSGGNVINTNKCKE